LKCAQVLLRREGKIKKLQKWQQKMGEARASQRQLEEKAKYLSELNSSFDRGKN